MNEQEIIARLQTLGGRMWEKGQYRRIYFNMRLVHDYMGLNVQYYNTGNVSGATLAGERISNSEARRIISALDDCKIYYDLTDGKIYYRGNSFGFKDYEGYVKEFCTYLRAEITEQVAA